MSIIIKQKITNYKIKKYLAIILKIIYTKHKLYVKLKKSQGGIVYDYNN